MSAETGFTEALRYHVNQLGNLVRGLQLIADYVTRNPRSRGARMLAADVGAILEHLAPERRPAELLAELGSLLQVDWPPGVSPRPAPRAANGVLVPLVDRRREASGLVRELRVEPAEPYAHGPMFPAAADPSFRDGLVQGCRAAQSVLDGIGMLAVRQIPDDYELHVERPPFGGNPRLQEESCWLAAAVSYLSLASGLPVDGVVAATGYLTPSGRIGELAHVEEKITACLRERPDVGRVLVLSADALPNAYRRDARVVRVDSLDAACEHVWGKGWKQNVQPRELSVHAALDRAMYAYAKEHDVCGAFERFTLIDRFLRMQPGDWQRLRFLCDWRLASCHNHLGHRDEAIRLFTRWADKAEELWRDGVIDSENYANFFASYGFFLARTGELDRGIELMRHALPLTEEHWTPRMHRAKLLSALGHLLMCKLEFAEAERNLLQAFEFATNRGFDLRRVPARTDRCRPRAPSVALWWRNAYRHQPRGVGAIPSRPRICASARRFPDDVYVRPGQNSTLPLSVSKRILAVSIFHPLLGAIPPMAPRWRH